MTGKHGFWHPCGFYFDIYLNIVPDHKHPQWQWFLSAGYCTVLHCKKMFWEWFEEHHKEPKVLTLPPTFPDLNLTEHLWDALENQVKSMESPP